MSGSHKPPQRKTTGMDLVDDKTKLGNLDTKLAAIICYAPIIPLNLIAAAVFLNTDDNKFLRFHAVQSLLLGGILVVSGFVLNICATILGIIPIIGGMLAAVLIIAWVIVIVGYMWLTINCIIDSSKGTTTKLPYLGEIAAGKM